MKKSIMIIKIILMIVFLLLSLPALYLCAMNIIIGLTHGIEKNYLPMLIVISIVIVLLDIMAVIGLIRTIKMICYENNQIQTSEASAGANVRRKYLRNSWFFVPLILPSICFVLNAMAELMFRLMYSSNIDQRTIDILDPYFSMIFALGTLSGLIIIFTTIPLAITSFVFKGIKKITLTELFVNISSYIFVFFFAAIVMGSRG